MNFPGGGSAASTRCAVQAVNSANPEKIRTTTATAVSTAVIMLYGVVNFDVAQEHFRPQLLFYKSPGQPMRFRNLIVSIGVTALVAGAVSCDDYTGPSESKYITIGGIFSLTGNWATLGVTSKAAMEIGIEDVNAYVAGSGYHFTASIQDTKLQPNTALSMVTSLKGTGVEVVIGPQSSAEVGVIKPYRDANTMIAISQSSTAGSLAIANDNVFRLTPSDTLEAVALVGLMKADGMTTSTPFLRNDGGNVGLRVATRALFPGPGIVKPGVEYGATQTDFAAPLATL